MSLSCLSLSQLLLSLQSRSRSALSSILKKSLLLIMFLVATLSPSVHAALVDKIVLNNLIFLLDSSNNQILRYDTSTSTFLDPVELSAGTVTAFDTADGTSFYVAINNELILFTVSDTGTTISTLRRTASDIVDLDLNGSYVVLTFGGAGSEIWSVRASDGVLVDRAPQFGVGEEAAFQSIAQIHYIESDNSYLVRQATGAAFFVGYDAANGTFGTYDVGDRLEDQNAVGSDQRLFFSEQHSLAVSTGGIAYPFNSGNFRGAYLDDSGSPIAFVSLYDAIASDSTVDDIASDGSSIYVAYTIDNACNNRNGGTHVGVYNYSSAFSTLSQTRNIDFVDSMEVIEVINGQIYGFYYSVDGLSVLGVSQSSTEPSEDWVDVTFDPANEIFQLTQDRVKVMGDDTVVLNIDEGCKHYIFEYDVSDQAYGRQVNVSSNVADYDVHSGQSRAYWAVNYDSGYTLNVSIEVGGAWTNTDDDELYKGSVQKILALDDYILINYKNAEGASSLAFRNLDFNTVAAETSTDTLVIGDWSYATWDSENQKIIFLSGGKLYSWDMPNLADLENATPPQESINFGTLTAATELQPFVIHNVKPSNMDLVYVAGNLFDIGSNGLLNEDVADARNNLATWDGSSLYATISSGQNSIQRWTFSLTDSQNLGLVAVTEQSEENIALVTVTLNSVPTALLLSYDANGRVNYQTNLDTSAQTIENNNTPETTDSGDSTTGGDNGGTDGDGGDSTDSGCSGICPDSSGGSINLTWLLLTALYTGLFTRAQKPIRR